MQIINRVFNCQPPVKNVGITSHASRASTFGQQLDIATSRRMDRCEFPKNRVCPDSEWELSPYVNLMAAYDEWKAQQPPQALPDSQGRTAENIAYLKERYSGRLSWVERVDMLNTMMDMGVITREQRNSAYGDDTVILTPDMTLAEMDAAREAHRKKDPWNQDWNVYFSEDPVNGFKTADDVFAWLNTLRP